MEDILDIIIEDEPSIMEIDLKSDLLKGDKGEKGEPFVYSDFTPEQLASLKGQDGVNGYTPIKGIDYRDGVDGINGTNGQDGYTPIKGVDYFDGVNGQNGIDGYTPVRGTDYWTTTDIQAIENYCKNYIDTNITQAIGGEY